MIPYVNFTSTTRGGVADSGSIVSAARKYKKVHVLPKRAQHLHHPRSHQGYQRRHTGGHFIRIQGWIDGAVAVLEFYEAANFPFGSIGGWPPAYDFPAHHSNDEVRMNKFDEHLHLRGFYIGI